MINAIVDALRPMGVGVITMPATPERVWRAINDSQGGGDAPTEQAAMPHFENEGGAQ